MTNAFSVMASPPKPSAASCPDQSSGLRNATAPEKCTTPSGSIRGMGRIAGSSAGLGPEFGVGAVLGGEGRHISSATVAPQGRGGSTLATHSGCSAVPSQVTSVSPGSTMGRTTSPGSRASRRTEVPSGLR